MIASRGRRSVALATALAAILLGGALSFAPAPARAHAPGIDRFMWALGQVESSGRYDARNPTSGAYGKYQIMPFNWPAWADRYLGDRKAKQTPRNQEIVARGRIHDLYHGLGKWHRVAYWWLTGSSKTKGWSSFATRYVRKVMRLYERKRPLTLADARRYQESSSAVDYTGRWVAARHRGYKGDRVLQATRAGSTASFTFTGTHLNVYGPVGPTRGKARIYVNGELATTIDLFARRYRPRTKLFGRTWAIPRERTVTIEVLGTRGRPVVAIDEFAVWD